MLTLAYVGKWPGLLFHDGTRKRPLVLSPQVLSGSYRKTCLGTGGDQASQAIRALLLQQHVLMLRIAQRQCPPAPVATLHKLEPVDAGRRRDNRVRTIRIPA